MMLPQSKTSILRRSLRGGQFPFITELPRFNRLKAVVNRLSKAIQSHKTRSLPFSPVQPQVKEHPPADSPEQVVRNISTHGIEVNSKANTNPFPPETARSASRTM